MSLFAELNSVFGTPGMESEDETIITEETTETEGVDPATVVEQDTVVTETPAESLPVAPEAVTNDETVETAIIDNAESEEQVEDLTEGMDTAEEVVAKAEALYATMESFLERGGMTEGERQIMAHALESLHDRVGLYFNPSQLGSLESFGDANTRYDATVAALEDIGDFMKKVGTGIKSAALRVMDAVREQIGVWRQNQDKLIERANAISSAVESITPEQAKEHKGTEQVLGRYARAFWFDGKVNSGVATAKRSQEVLKQVEAKWNPAPIADAYAKAIAGMKQVYDTVDTTDEEGNVTGQTKVPSVLVDGTDMLIKTAGGMFKDPVDPKLVSAYQKLRNAQAQYTGSKELPGGYRIVESQVKGFMETTTSTDEEGNETSSTKLAIGGKGKTRALTALIHATKGNRVFLVRSDKGQADQSKQPVAIATPGDIKTICKLVVEGCELTKRIIEKMKAAETKLSSAKSAIGALTNRNNDKGLSEAQQAMTAVMTGFTHLPDVAAIANKRSLITSKNLLDYCDTCIKIMTGKKKEEASTEEASVETEE